LAAVGALASVAWSATVGVWVSVAGWEEGVDGRELDGDVVGALVEDLRGLDERTMN
jgi:hypothetical protein